jgi:acyl-CoA thioesterase I
MLLGLALAPTRPIRGAEEPQPAAPDQAKNGAPVHELSPVWSSGTVYGESCLFVQESDDKPPAASLLFAVDRLEMVQSASRELRYERGTDFDLSADGRTIVLLPGSRIPFRLFAELYPPKGSPNSIGSSAADANTSLLFGEGHFFHDQQVAVTYRRREQKWTGYTPKFAAGLLPKTINRLRAKKPFVIGVSGDSISQGYNASSYTGAPPRQPAYPRLVADELARVYGSQVTLRNRAVAGWSVGQGLGDLDQLLAEKPDLVIVAYGMNDVGGRNPEAYKNEIAAMIKRIRDANADAEVILVSTMLGNPEWTATPPEMFPKFRDALASLGGPGVAMADMTSLWQELLTRKRYVDLTGNGVNHPNDFGHRLYAQVILALLVDPELAKH